MNTANKVESLQIQIQQTIAKEVLESLAILDPNCVLAGGAPRDWYLGKPAKDLDFYFQGLTDSALGKVVRQLSKVLGVPEESFVHLCGAQNPLGDGDNPPYKGEYSRMKNLVRVIELEYLGIKIQFMEMSEKTFGVVEEFSCDICQFWWKGYEVKGTKQALSSVENKVITFKEGYGDEHKHVKKMKERFYWYVFKFYEEFPESKGGSESVFKLDDLSYQRGVCGMPDHWSVKFSVGGKSMCDSFLNRKEAERFIDNNFKEVPEYEGVTIDKEI